jgi:hypothetical protein
MSDDHKATNAVSLDAVYTQVHAELRSHRDHELSVATWFTFLQLAFLGSIVAWKYTAAGFPLGVALERCPSLKSFLAAAPVLLGTYGAWSIAHAMRKYEQLRKWVTDTLEPTVSTFPLDQASISFLKPGTLMCAILLFLGIFSAILIIHRPSVLG